MSEHTWSFGKNRAGNLELLARLGEELGFSEVGVEVVKIGDLIVSSTLVRAAVEQGDLFTAEEMLGRPYTVLGTVQSGDQLGRTIGYPTANISAHSEQFPPNGVYAVRLRLAERLLGGVANIGVRPTIKNASGERVFEVHIFDLAEDLYERDLEITFRGFIRGEQRFSSLEELKAQIARDAQKARLLLA